MLEQCTDMPDGICQRLLQPLELREEKRKAILDGYIP
jgi:hypothetical protein